MLCYHKIITQLNLAEHPLILSLLKRKTPLDQFIDGLKVLNLHQLLQMHPEQMRPYFTHAESTLKQRSHHVLV